MRPLLATVAVAMIQSAALVFGEPFQFGSCASPQTAQNTAPSEPAPSPNHPSVVIPTEQRHRCKFTLQINRRAILMTVPVSEPSTPVILGSFDAQIESCSAIQTNCPNLVVAVPTPQGGICCQRKKNRPHLCASLDLRFLREPEWQLRLIRTPVPANCVPR
jgi:hypothetical protein